MLEINNSNVPALGELTLEKLHYLVEHSLHALVVEHHTPVGFCITFAPNAPYDSLNYLWFCERYEQFVYLDRIAFVPDAQGMGLGKVLYQHSCALVDQHAPRGHVTGSKTACAHLKGGDVRFAAVDCHSCIT